MNTAAEAQVAHRIQSPAPQQCWSSVALLLGLTLAAAALMANAAFIGHTAYILGIGPLLANCVIVPVLEETTYQVATTAPTTWERALGWTAYAVVLVWPVIMG